MNITEASLSNLIQYYGLLNAAQLADRLNTSQGVVSNWKTRNALGALVDKVVAEDESALPYLFPNNEKDKSNQTINQINGGQNAQNINGNQVQSSKQEKNDDIDPATYNLFLEAYNKAIEDDNLKALRIHLMDY